MNRTDQDIVTDTQWQLSDRAKRFLFCAVLFLFLLVAYGNSFHGGWHFDDHPNIIDNPGVHLRALDLQGLKESLFFKGRLTRPVAYFSFALNHYFGGLDVFGYHLFNFAVHYLGAVFLFLFVHSVLKLPLLADRYGGDAFVIAALSSLLWAVNPVQVLAVSMIVQRMASMAALFYIMAMYCYLKGRTAPPASRRIIWFFMTGVCALLAFGTKQNAAMLPVSLFLLDLFLIQGVRGETVKKYVKISVIPILIVIILGSLYTNVSSMLNGFNGRPFTFAERLMTEPRVIIFYLSLLFFPAGSRLTLLHDIEISRSLLQPWTTVPALLLLCCLVCLSLVVARRRPLLSYCVLFFFLNHFIEGSVLPLEIAYEHRNYLPSMLLFVPVAILMIRVTAFFSHKRNVQVLAVGMMALLLIWQGHTVFKRNTILMHEETFWLDNLKKAPGLSRTHGEIGKILLSKGDPASFEALTNALKIARYSHAAEPWVYHSNLGNYYMIIENNPAAALDHYHKALKYKKAADVYNSMAITCAIQGNLEKAYVYSRATVQTAPHNAVYHGNFSQILLQRGMLDEAIAEALKTLELQKGNMGVLPILGEAYRKKENFGESARYWEYYSVRDPRNLKVWANLIFLYDRLGDHDGLTRAVARLLLLKGEKKIDDVAGALNQLPPLVDGRNNAEILLPIMRTIAKEQYAGQRLAPSSAE